MTSKEVNPIIYNVLVNLFAILGGGMLSCGTIGILYAIYYWPMAIFSIIVGAISICIIAVFIEYSQNRTAERHMCIVHLEARMATFHKTKTIEEYKWILSEIINLGQYSQEDYIIWLACLLDICPEFYQDTPVENKIIGNATNVEMHNMFINNTIETVKDLDDYNNCLRIRKWISA